MNNRSGTLSPVSMEGSEWSGISKYQSLDPAGSYSPPLPGNRGGPLMTPPVSRSSAGGSNGIPVNGMSRRPRDSQGNPSPPSSIARSSDGAGLYAANDGGSVRKAFVLEENLAEHHIALKRYLAPSLRDDKGNPRPTRARDKLLRLSAVQFQELSTDVYDELLRRQGAAGARGPGPYQMEQPPPYLLPKDTFHPKRNQARQKLSTLPPPRFRDLATDVYFELERRFPRFAGGEIDRIGSPASIRSGYRGPNGPPNGMPRPGSRGFGPRPPGPPGPSGPGGLGVPGSHPVNDYGRPLQKTFQSNTIIPNKSTMVEEDDDMAGAEEEDIIGEIADGASEKRSSGEDTAQIVKQYESKVEELQSKVNDLTTGMDRKDKELADLRASVDQDQKTFNTEKQEWLGLRADLENKLNEARNLNDTLQEQIDRVRADNANAERDLRAQLENIHGAAQGQSNEELRTRLREQELITEEVKREATQFLQEMKALSERNDETWAREEKLQQQVARMEEEVKEWKSRYARTRTQLRNLRASSGLSIEQQNVAQLARDGGLTSSDGSVKDIHVTRFQIAIDDLLRAARIAEPATILDHMKAVVVSVRNITQDLGTVDLDGDGLSSDKAKLRTRVSATANNLITACKNYAASSGLSPVSLLDAAASHLTAAIVELVKLVKIRPTTGNEDDEGGEPSPGGSPYFPIRSGNADPPYRRERDSAVRRRSEINDGRRPRSRLGYMENGTSLGHSVTSANGTSAKTPEIDELKIYLEDQTEALVQSIQSLVSTIRGKQDEGMNSIRHHIQDIAQVVQNVVHSTESTIERTESATLRERCEPVVQTLAQCRSKLLTSSLDGEQIQDPAALKQYINRLPPQAFDIARQTKELVQRIDQIDSAF